MMKHMVLSGALMLACASSAISADMPTPAESADRLGKCIVAKTTAQDRLGLARWSVSAILSAPAFADLGKVDSAKREESDRFVAALMTRLLTVDCLEESRLTAKVGGSAAFRTAGEQLGRAAMAELMGSKETIAAMRGFTNYLNPADFKVLAE